ncbi:MAG: CRTAC1 family protein [Planctomycetota bacterium]
MRRGSRLAGVLALVATLGGCGGGGTDEASPGDADSAAITAEAEAEAALAEASADPIRFRDATVGSGLDAFTQENGNREKPFILESIGAGVALLDHDLDGDLDAYLANGSSLEGFAPGEEPRDALFAGDGTGRFTDVTAAAGLGHPGWTMGVTVGDVEGDGDPDLFLTAYGPNALFLNDGAGVYAEATADAGLGDERWGTGASFLDYDADGDLDLYVANYVHFNQRWIERNQARQDYRGVQVYFGPTGLLGVPDLLYRNEGGAFVDVSEEAGITGPKLHGFQVVTLDYDLDGRSDLYVANDSHRNLLWRNEGDGTFVDHAERAAVARSKSGAEQAGMGVAVGDAHADGLLDLYVTNFAEDYFTLYRGEPAGLFRDVTYRAGLGAPTRASLGWSCAFEDFDLDGDVDLFVVNGHVYPQVDLFDLGTRYRQRNQAFENDGEGRFRTVAQGHGLAVERCSRGAAFGDVDEDGDVDVLVANLDDVPTLLLNESERRGTWVRLRLRGTATNPDAIGARVELSAGGTTQTRVAGCGTGFLSRSDRRLVFGLGAAERVDEVRVHWPGGEVERFVELTAGEEHVLVEGEGAR